MMFDNVLLCLVSRAMIGIGACAVSNPYWNCHGTDQAMTFGAYVRNFAALI